jgi:hypothetical protein
MKIGHNQTGLPILNHTYGHTKYKNILAKQGTIARGQKTCRGMDIG